MSEVREPAGPLDKAGKDYWDSVWQRRPPPPVVGAAGERGYVDRGFEKLFHRIFEGIDTAGRRLIEVGCANSTWLALLAREFGFRVAGLDYSEIGCEQARHVLAAARVEGEIVCADVFEPPARLLSLFDVAISFGVVEHFADTAAGASAISKLVAPGGLVVTSIPNLSGSIGTLTRLLNPRVYEMHSRLTASELASAHERAGLDVVECRYFLSTSFGVANLEGLQTGTAAFRAKSAVLRLLKGLSKATWAMERAGPLPATRLFSPYVVCVARKP